MLTGCVPWPEDLATRYRKAGHWRGEVLGDLLRGPAAGDPARTAVVTATGRHSYGELDERADRLAAGLADLGLEPGQRVVVALPNDLDFVVVCVALFRLGAIPVLGLVAHRRAELSYLVRASGAVALIAPDVHRGYDHRALAAEVVAESPGLRHVLISGKAGEFTALADVSAPPRKLPEPQADEVAFFLLSGGTTGKPKLIPRTHDDYAYQLRATAEAMRFDATSTYLAVLPAGHNAALGCPGVLGALRAGGTVVLAGSPSPDEVFPLIAAEKPDLTTVMPAVLTLWLDTASLFDVDTSGLVIEVGGAMLSPETAERVRAELGATLTHWFGMAEGFLAFTRLDDPPERAATSQGTAMSPDDEIRIVDDDGHPVPDGEVGQLLVRGPCVLRGYYDVPEHNAEVFTTNGFLRTGDLVRRAPDGAITATGRVKHTINRGGEKISGDELEGELAAHPAVRAVAVVPVPDTAFGEKTCAVVVPEGDPPTLDDLRAFLTGRGIAEFKHPDRLRVVSSLPHTAVGKVDRRELAADATPEG
ncbi:(2,3-dihydroxybenzoyl)adenylate synthase [Amycolatopsis sp. CA-230715]|uniref:(2,3-dihydroxybenzoyl)adenylate synthase n=1 Tax=Amycolatopsis sp. CA-230715 TaxID=2745196 RepID=UPI001C017D9E|nr:AMP-binding protein [Amycolatopsis sp. CA-230715]QWF84836.1 2,3-dihydroxybenzoate-AMP ligase [Amycolatopsis sp. CA-230715]